MATAAALLSSHIPGLFWAVFNHWSVDACCSPCHAFKICLSRNIYLMFSKEKNPPFDLHSRSICLLYQIATSICTFTVWFFSRVFLAHKWCLKDISTRTIFMICLSSWCIANHMAKHSLCSYMARFTAQQAWEAFILNRCVLRKKTQHSTSKVEG